MTAELNAVTELGIYLSLLIVYVSSVISVHDLLGTVLREMIHKHIVLRIISFIIFQSHYRPSAALTEGKYTCKYRKRLIIRSCDINVNSYSIHYTNSWHVSFPHVEVLLYHCNLQVLVFATCVSFAFFCLSVCSLSLINF
jgi:hypothetical protein